jgi:hypothetical protein
MSPCLQAKEIMYHKANLNRIMADYTVGVFKCAICAHGRCFFAYAHVCPHCDKQADVNARARPIVRIQSMKACGRW